MPPKRKNDFVIAVCIQEPMEDGCSMDFGSIEGDELRFLHQAFITDTLLNTLEVEDADIRLYYIGLPQRKRLVKIVTDYISKKLLGNEAEEFQRRFSDHELEKERWGIRIEKVFKECFDTGYKHVLVIGSRTPTIGQKMFKIAHRMLKESDAVFGPTPEGRYYSIGMTGSYKINLSNFDWKSPSIYSEVANAFTSEALAWSELDIWYCVDTTDDLEMVVRDINQSRFEGDELTAHETEKVIERILAKLEP